MRYSCMLTPQRRTAAPAFNTATICCRVLVVFSFSKPSKSTKNRLTKLSEYSPQDTQRCNGGPSCRTKRRSCRGSTTSTDYDSCLSHSGEDKWQDHGEDSENQGAQLAAQQVQGLLIEGLDEHIPQGHPLTDKYPHSPADGVQSFTSSTHFNTNCVQCSNLQQQLQTEQARTAEGRSQVAAFKNAQAGLSRTLEERLAALELAQKQTQQLQETQQQKEDAVAAPAARHKQLTVLHGTLASSKVTQQQLQQQVAGWQARLAISQQEQEQLKASQQEQLAGLQNDNRLLQAQLRSQSAAREAALLYSESELNATRRDRSQTQAALEASEAALKSAHAALKSAHEQIQQLQQAQQHSEDAAAADTRERHAQAALQSGQEQIQQLQQALRQSEEVAAAAKAAAAANYEHLSTDLATLHESSSMTQRESQQQIDEQQARLLAAQQEQAQLHDTIDEVRNDNRFLQVQLSSAQEATDDLKSQVTSKDYQVQQLHQDLANAEATISILGRDLQESQQQLARLQQPLIIE